VEVNWSATSEKGSARESVFQTETASQSVSWTAQKEGHYRWRVVALAEDAEAGHTDWNTFDVLTVAPVVLSKPQDQQKFEYWKLPAEFSFAWEFDAREVQGKTRFRWEIAREADFRVGVRRIETQEATLTSVKAKVTEGLWFWRVSVLGSGGQVIQQSDVRSFEHVPFPLLQAPERFRPETGTVVVKNRSTEDPELTWSEVENAKAYQVMVWKEKKLWKTIKVNKPAWKLKGALPGDYFWKVRPIDALNRLGHSAAIQKITVKKPQKLRAPQFQLKG
jgi:hypothetical protein